MLTKCPDRVDFKCCPPIRDRENQKSLWAALKTGDIDMIVSDHSPSLPHIKLLNDGPDYGNFIKSWGGIPGVQFGLFKFGVRIEISVILSRNFFRFLI